MSALRNIADAIGNRGNRLINSMRAFVADAVRRAGAPPQAHSVGVAPVPLATPASPSGKALATNEAMQTIGLGALGVALVGVMLVGGIFVVIGLTLAFACCGLIIVLHWQELRGALAARRFNRHFVLPMAFVILVPILGLLVANKDAILGWNAASKRADAGVVHTMFNNRAPVSLMVPSHKGDFVLPPWHNGRGVLPFRVTRLDYPIVGPAGFDIRDSENDDPAFAVPIFAIQNLSPDDLLLDLSMSVDGEDHHFELSGDGRGSWNRRLGMNDWIAHDIHKGDPYTISVSPIRLSARQIGYFNPVFVVPNLNKNQKKIFLNMNTSLYEFTIHIKDHKSGKSIDVIVPDTYPSCSVC